MATVMSVVMAMVMMAAVTAVAIEVEAAICGMAARVFDLAKGRLRPQCVAREPNTKARSGRT